MASLAAQIAEARKTKGSIRSPIKSVTKVASSSNSRPSSSSKRVIINDTPIEKLQNEISKATYKGQTPTYKVEAWKQDPKTGEINAKITINGREFIAKSPQDGINILNQIKRF